MKQSKQRRWISTILAVIVLFPLMTVADNQAAESSEVIERILWKKMPIAVTLIVGQERLVHFPDSVSVGVPQSLTPILRSQSINGTLYLTAREPFEASRVIVRSEQGEPVYVLDISAKEADPEGARLPTLQILVENPLPDELASNNTAISSAQWGYVALTRYAAQQLYAPARLLPNALGIVRVPVTQQSFELILGGQVEAVPVAAWKAGLRNITAVRLTNKTQYPVVLDPRQLRGTWLTASFQHNRLLPSGNEADSTAAYLVSDRPFDVSF